MLQCNEFNTQDGGTLMCIAGFALLYSCPLKPLIKCFPFCIATTVLILHTSLQNVCEDLAAKVTRTPWWILYCHRHQSRFMSVELSPSSTLKVSSYIDGWGPPPQGELETPLGIGDLVNSLEMALCPTSYHLIIHLISTDQGLGDT